jgi:hypothetical protein
MSAAGACQLGPITGVTITTADLAAAVAAYARSLGYRITSRGTVSPAQARVWQRPRSSGCRFVCLSPAQADDFAIRFIETVPAPHRYRAFSSYGWNAAELIVRNVDELAGRLANGPFEILGPPQDLSFTDAIRAMQVRGPSGEILYLTEFKRPLPGLEAPPARCDVDRVFIVIVAGPSLDELAAFYTSRFQVPEPARMESRVKAMSEVFGLSPDHRYQIAALPLREHSYIEADQMPPGAAATDTAAGQLPPGIALVSFRANHPSGLRQEAACITGPAGELIELVGAG